MSRKLVLYCDGASRGNPGRGAWAIISSERTAFCGLINPTTNNVAEYLAIYHGLSLHREGYDKITILSDSQLAIKQILGVYSINSQELIKLYNQIKHLINQSETKIEFKWVPRSNLGMIKADKLCNTILDVNIW